MTTVTIDLLREDAWDLLRQLERLSILRIQQPRPQSPSLESSKDAKAFLLKGLPEKENFDTWVADWEASRQDRVLPFEENP